MPTTAPLHTKLAALLAPERVRTRLIDRVSYASDAGFYTLTPQAVVFPNSIEEVRRLFAFSQDEGIPITFRTAGTSLSGQAITEGILVEVSRYWRNYEILAQGAQVRVQPGLIGGQVNQYLKDLGRKIGPDPASIASCMMGGILANNSSGMCCGVQYNAYHTLESIHFLLPNGYQYNTAIPADYTRFERECAEIAQTLTHLRARISYDTALADKIRRKYRQKNTVGYALNSFLDYTHPLDILAHLLIGSEGTLGFIAEAVLNTIPDKPYKTTAMLYFADMYAACEAIAPLRESGAEALELFDYASLASVCTTPEIARVWTHIPPNSAAILTEYQCTSPETLAEIQAQLPDIVHRLPLIVPADFTHDHARQEILWKVRKGLIPSVGAVRAAGTTVVFEDIVFPVERLADGVRDTQQLFADFGYTDGIIFGHAKDGNIHFVVTQSFDTQAEIQRYAAFMDALAAMVVGKYEGALKAEHGTGRNMAPYVATEWGEEAYQIMRELKAVIDPHQILNPGVILNDNPHAHISHLKNLPTIEPEVDKCIECGFCEKNCPSRELTLSPRRRIVVRRALQRFRAAGDTRAYQELLRQYDYDGLATCAVDGLCATDCPVGINTGLLVKKLRADQHNTLQRQAALRLAKNFQTLERALRRPLQAGSWLNRRLGKHTLSRLTAWLRELSIPVPRWSDQLLAPPPLMVNNPREAQYVYLPTCISRVMGAGVAGKISLSEAIFQVCLRAGISLRIPYSVGVCCGQPFSSKGFPEAYAHAANRTVEQVWAWTDGGRLPVVIDGSSCTYTLRHLAELMTPENLPRYQKLRFLDSVDFLAEVVMPRVQISQPKSRIVLHPVCSLTKMGNAPLLTAIAQQCAQEVIVPRAAGCCGMAGDRGFIVPELTASATQAEAAEVRQISCEGHYSTAKTCEIALSDATGKSYEGIWYLVLETTNGQ